jgi:hypothetical protein
LLAKHLTVGLAIGIKEIMFTPFPSGFQFGPGDIPIGTAFLQHSAQVLPKLFDGWSAKEPIAIGWLRRYRELVDRKEQMIAEDHPNCLVLPFSVELIRLAA